MARGGSERRERLVRVLAGATFLIFFQAFMIAPLIPRLAESFHVGVFEIGAAVPAYLLPYGAATLVHGVLSDRVGRRRLILGSLAAFCLMSLLTAAAPSARAFLLLRIATGIGASAVVPLSLVIVGASYPFAERGRPLGWLFGAMAGGMAFGSTAAALLEPVLGWRGVFAGVAAGGLGVGAAIAPLRGLLGERGAAPPPLRAVMAGYRALLTTARGARTYAFVFANALFHSGVFTWLGLYFHERYGLSEPQIGLALLGYGIPGFVLGPAIGRAADSRGRRVLLPAGLLLGSLGAASLAPSMPVLAAALAVTLLSLGYDMTQPLLAGIVTDVGRDRPGQAMGLNVFLLFTGSAVGSVLFGVVLQRASVQTALIVFAFLEVVLGAAAVALFRREAPAKTARSGVAHDDIAAK